MDTSDYGQNPMSDIAFLLGSFTDQGRSLRSFMQHPQELAICILTAGLMANSKTMLDPEDAVRAAFGIHQRIQKHVSQYQSLAFASQVENCFTERPPEVEHD